MFANWLRIGSSAIFALGLSVHAWASTPAENPLLRLVPVNAQIVAGIEDPHHADQSGRLLLVTHNDNVDLRDWIALAGVDDRQHVDKLIEVAASSARGELSEHLLLARGSFDGRRILEAARENGSVAIRYDDVRVAEVKPFLRETKQMRETRWLAIPDDSTVIFGSPVMVKSALDRFVAHTGVDAGLAQRVGDLERDVNCWSILTMRGEMIATHMLRGVLDESGVALVNGSNSLSLSVHYGSKERVNFALGMQDRGAANAVATAIRGPGHLLPVADEWHSRLENVSVRGTEVRGSLVVGEKEFDLWLSAATKRVATREVNVAQADALHR